MPMNISMNSTPIHFQGSKSVGDVTPREWQQYNYGQDPQQKNKAAFAFNKALSEASAYQRDGIPARAYSYEQPGTQPHTVDSVHIGVVSGADAVPLLLMKRLEDAPLGNRDAYIRNPRVRQATDEVSKAIDALNKSLRKLAYVQATEEDASADPENQLTYARIAGSGYHDQCL